ncbi:Glycosyltransferase family 4 protein [Candidatus Hydrogenisulfobacillus filiaventi]|uniref:Glycosyltransferase family 4 protein n=1 Tax=Candidatus Hydrogenisulfobacillus filiaventi TaxID=2707344 RepID=A0A6F8ZD88_9FIRM|nr:Glycosyltransferase family 4 protein [Candidatus Hydrogenisulfobacillus filiaventi]
MRVLMISKACVNALYRRKLEDLNRLGAADGIEVGLVVPPAWGSLPFEPGPGDHYPLFVEPIWFSGRNHFHRYPGLGRVLDRFRPQLLHIDEEHYSWVTREALGLAARRGVPALFFTWQNLYKRYPWPVRRWEAQVLQGAAGALAGNQEAAEVLRRKGYRGPLAVVPQFGTDPAVFRPDPARRQAVRAARGWTDRVVVGYVGRLVAEKGLDDLWAALTPLLARDPALHLVFIGSGPWQPSVPPGLAGQVEQVPWAPSEEMPGLLGALDLLVLPSRTTPRWKEQFGRVLTEAMASGTPVVGSSSGEIPHVIGPAGVVFPEGDVAALQAAVAELAGDPARRRALGEAGRARVRERFTTEAVARATLDFYRRLLTEGGARSRTEV